MKHTGGRFHLHLQSLVLSSFHIPMCNISRLHITRCTISSCCGTACFPTDESSDPALTTKYCEQGASVLQLPEDPWIDKLAMKLGRLSLNDTASVSQPPDDPWIGRLATKLGRLSLHDTNDPEVDNLAELLSRLGIDDFIQELA
jgi:hypothetical protein